MHINLEQLTNRYLDAKDYVIQAGYSWEIDWQADRSFSSLTECDFLKETAWVILSSGFKESIVRRIFPKISEAFLHWENANEINSLLVDCRNNALKCFRNKRKIEAICHLITKVSNDGFTNIKRHIQNNGLKYIKKIPFIGPVTGLHLLKNIGISIAKPDRHLVRIADTIGFGSVQDLCKTIGDMVGDDVAEIDIVLWRYATLRPDYISFFQFHEMHLPVQ